MGKLYADRAFVEINGFEQLDLKTAHLTRNPNVKKVETMSRTRRSAGYQFGNLDVSVALSFFIPNNRAILDIGIADPTKAVNLVFIVGGERYTCKDGAEKDMSTQGSVGDASKDVNLIFLDCVNENGTSVNTDISLG